MALTSMRNGLQLKEQVHSAQKSTVAAQNQKCNSRLDVVCKQQVEGKNTARIKKLALHTRSNIQEYREASMAAKNMQRNKLMKESSLKRQVNGITTAKS